ncbi:hypothetical protein GCM10010176_012830 [Nonomuraea spiralis]|nr:hypothetical protein GCM10010176_012830 [Nonomuraea spiralis]
MVAFAVLRGPMRRTPEQCLWWLFGVARFDSVIALFCYAAAIAGGVFAAIQLVEMS